MVVFTAKLNKKRLIALVIAIAAVIATLILLLPNRESRAMSSEPTAKVLKGIKTEEDRTKYLQSLGYEIAQEPLRSQKVVIPKEFDQVYLNYNQLQTDCGFDLEKYRGKQVTLYTYAVTNYPQETEARADLLIYKDKIVGGAVYSAAIDGFMHGLKATETAAAPANPTTPDAPIAPTTPTAPAK